MDPLKHLKEAAATLQQDLKVAAAALQRQREETKTRESISRAKAARSGMRPIPVSPLPYTPTPTMRRVTAVWKVFPHLSGANVIQVGIQGQVSRDYVRMLAALPPFISQRLIAAGVTWRVSDQLTAGQMDGSTGQARSSDGQPRDVSLVSALYDGSTRTVFCGKDLEGGMGGLGSEPEQILHESGHAVWDLLLDDQAKQRMRIVHAGLPLGIIDPYFHSQPGEAKDSGVDELFAQSVMIMTYHGYDAVEALAGTLWANAFLYEWALLRRPR